MSCSDGDLVARPHVEWHWQVAGTLVPRNVRTLGAGRDDVSGFAVKVERDVHDERAEGARRRCTDSPAPPSGVRLLSGAVAHRKRLSIIGGASTLCWTAWCCSLTESFGLIVSSESELRAWNGLRSTLSAAPDPWRGAAEGAQQRRTRGRHHVVGWSHWA
eukprot:426331-Prymnesium_polylepis.1